MGWMFLPLVQYHGGGTAATIEPLREHLAHYQQHLINLFNAGVQVCYFGPRPYDAPQTREVVKRWVAFYKKYRSIFDADAIHLMRPYGRNWDGLLHVNPQRRFKGMLVIHNPTNQTIKKKLNIPLYYTGLKEQAEFIDWHGKHKIFKLQNYEKVTLPVELEPGSVSWWLIK